MTTPFTLDAVASVSPFLTPARTRCLLRFVLRLSEEDSAAQIGPGVSLFLWLADHLGSWGVASPDQQELVLGETQAEIVSFGSRLWGTLEKYEADRVSNLDLPAAHLTFWDRRFASVTGRPGFLDLRSGRWVGSLTVAPLTAESVDLTSLFTRQRAVVVKRSHGKETSDAARRSHEGVG